jgi:hypothetical protein
MNTFANNSIEDLNKKICLALNISYEKYQTMTLSEQFKVRTKYVRMINKSAK